MKLNSKNIRLILAASLVLSLVAFFAITFLGLSVLSSKSQKIVDLKVQSQTADAQLANLQSSKKQIEQYSYFKNVAATVIPSDKDQAESVLEIFQMANASGIDIQSITFPASSLGLTTSTTTTQQDATSASSTKSALSQAAPVQGIPGLYSLELTITPDSSLSVPTSQQITYAKMLDFLNRIENDRRTAQITQVNIQPPTSTSSLSFSLVVNIFIKP
ncbi:MAG: hypothetical protein ACREGG_00295 [Candidatus Saccharimonadales bacterium]